VPQRTVYQNFLEPLETKATERLYKIGLNTFKDFAKAEDYEELLSKGTTDTIADFIQHLKDKGNSRRTIRSYLTGVKHFYVMNDNTSINWAKMRKFLGKVQTKNNNDGLYSKEQLQRLMEVATERERIAFLLMLSAGLRIGTLPDLKVGDLTKMNGEGLYKIRVYSGTSSEYITFCSPECSTAIDSYLELRKRKGEKITADSPLLATLGDDTRSLKLNSVISLLNRVLLDAGVRIEGDTKYLRQRVARFHSFRKHFNTCLAKAGVRPALKEVLMGHYIGLESSYLRPTEDELMTEYLKAVDLLTISEEKHLRHQVEKLKTEVSDIDTLKKMHFDTKMELEKERQERAKLYEVLYKQGIIKQGPSSA
jgi:site-specific recombinase XerD